MLSAVRDLVVDSAVADHNGVELVVGLEDGVCDPLLPVRDDELPVQVVRDSSPVLHFRHHVLDGLPRVGNVGARALGHVLVDVAQGGLEVRVVELVGDTEPERSELPPLLHDRVHEAHGEDQGPPLVVRLDLFKEVLVDHGGERSVEACLETLGGLGGDLDGHLKEAERELRVRLAGNPESEIFVDLGVLGVEDFLHLGHELQGQMAVVEHHPLARDKSVLDHFQSWLLHLLSHRDFARRVLLLPLGELVDVVGGIGTRGEQVENRPVWRGLLPKSCDGVGGWLHVLVAQHLPDELVAAQKRSVLSEGPDQAEMHEMPDVLVGIDLLLVVWHWHCLRLVRSDPLSPDRLVPLNSLWDFLEEERVLVRELVLRQGLQVEPRLLVHPVEWLVPVVDAGPALEQDVHVRRGQPALFDQALQAHHQLERHLVPFEEASVDVPVDFLGELRGDVQDPFLDQLGLRGVVNRPIEQAEELLKRSVVHPVHQRHFHDAEVEHRSSGGDHSEGLSLFVDLDSLLL